MMLKHRIRSLQALRTGLVSLAIFQLAVGASLASRPPHNHPATVTPRTPIKHVIVIIGENRSFDHVFATYVPKNGADGLESLSEGIVKADGTPGPNFSKAEQKAATIRLPTHFLLSPAKSSFSEQCSSRPARWRTHRPRT